MNKVVPQRATSSNKNVSTSATSRAERAAILDLRVATGVGRKGSCSSRPRSDVWNYFGYLHTVNDDGSAGRTMNDERIYCK